MRMKTNIIWIARTFLLVMIFTFGVFFIGDNHVFANENYTLPTDDTWTETRTTSYNNIDTYSITLEKPGRLTVLCQAFTPNAYFYFKDGNEYTEFWYATSINTNTSDTNPWSTTKDFDLEKGTYLIQVKSANNNSTKTRLKASFIAANNNETESNNEFSTAMSLSKGKKVTGFLSETDEIDFYKFTISAASIVNVNLYNESMTYSHFDIFNGDLQRINNYYNIDNGDSGSREMELASGTYYIKVFNGINTGKYILNWNTVLKDNKVWGYDLGWKDGARNARTFKITAGNDKNVPMTYKSSNSYVKVSSTGIVTVPGYYTGTTYITVTASQTTKYKAASKKLYLNVKPAKMLAPKLSKAGKKSFRIAWNKCKYVNGVEINYGTDKYFGNYKTKKMNNTADVFNVKGLKRRTTYYVRIRSYKSINGYRYYSAWSVIKKIKTK